MNFKKISHFYLATSGKVTIKKNCNNYLVYDNKLKKKLICNKDFVDLLFLCNGLNNIQSIFKKLKKLNSKLKINLDQLTNIINKLYTEKLIYFRKKPKKILIKNRINNLSNNLDIVYLELTNRCNFNCIHCYLNSPKTLIKKELTTKQYFNIIDILDNLGVISIIITGGEPFLRKDILKIVRYINSKHISITILSNGSLLNDKIISFLKKINITKIAISFDSYKKNIFNKIRGVNKYDLVLKNIKKIISYKLNLEINLVLFKNLNSSNSHILNFLKFLKKTNIFAKNITYDIFVPVGSGENKTNLVIDQLQTISSLQDAFLKVYSVNILEKIIKSESSDSFCGVGKNILYIDSIGDLYLCPGFKKQEFLLGSILSNNFKDIWENNKLFLYFRNKEYLKNSLCLNCNYLKFCNGGCKARAYDFLGSINNIDSWRCNFYEQANKQKL